MVVLKNSDSLKTFPDVAMGFPWFHDNNTGGWSINFRQKKKVLDTN